MDVLARAKLWLILLLTLLCTACTTTYSPCTGNHTMTDTYLTETILNRYRADQSLYFQDLHVITNERTVTVRGTVENYTQATAAVMLAKTTPGVCCVISKIVVRCCVNHTEFQGFNTKTKECGA